MISGIILAAGESSRMGSPKALLKIGGKSFVQHIVDVFIASRVLDIVVVLGADSEAIKTQLNWFKGKTVINEEWKRGQLSSILAGLHAVDQEDLHGVLIWPVDRPLVSEHVIVGILHQFWTKHKQIVVPVFSGQRGHPVLVGKSLFEALEKAPMDIGARTVLWDHPKDVLEYQTEEDGVVINIDSAEDYQKYVLNRAELS
ncbi:MAG: nucleotidyltransferase family protein [Bacteroidota bacterium]